MSPDLKLIEGSVVAPIGYRAGGVFCNIKQIGTGKGSEKGQKPDLALILSEVPAVAAGMFTTNHVKAAPVIVSLKHIKSKTVRAIIANSGNANACTGQQGIRDAQKMCCLTAHAITQTAYSGNLKGIVKNLPIHPSQILVASTGRIGIPLPMDRVEEGIKKITQALGTTPQDAHLAAIAIMTSDTRPKEIAVEFKIRNYTVRIGGICKGAGMIHPQMSPKGQRPPSMPANLCHATMLCFLTTDVSISTVALQRCLTEAVADSFNKITVDGDTSTNDTVAILANGLAGNPTITLADFKGQSGLKHQLAKAFFEALCYVCKELASMIVHDGEGVHRIVLIKVTGAASRKQADAVARTVANSPLVKTSWHGGDPNWGRIMAAIGYSPVKIDPTKIDIGYSHIDSTHILWCVKKGAPTTVPFKQLCKAVQPNEFVIHIDLNSGKYSSHMYAADLTEAYVEFNKGDVSNPESLGG